MQSAHFLVQKHFGLSKFMVCPHGQGRKGIEAVRTFFGHGKGSQIFAILCRRLLWTAPYYIPELVRLFTMTGNCKFASTGCVTLK